MAKRFIRYALTSLMLVSLGFAVAFSNAGYGQEAFMCALASYVPAYAVPLMGRPA